MRRRAEKARLRDLGSRRQYFRTPRNAAKSTTISNTDNTTFHATRFDRRSSGPGRAKVFWWVDALVKGGMSDELKLVFCKMCRGLRDQALAEKFLQCLVANDETLDGNAFKILVQMCGQGVRRKSCRGEPLFELGKDVSPEERKARVKFMMLGCKMADRFLVHAEEMGLGTDKAVMVAFSQCFRALRKPENGADLIKAVMKKQVIPPPSVFASVAAGAKENGMVELEEEVKGLMSKVGYKWDDDKFQEILEKQNSKLATAAAEKSDVPTEGILGEAMRKEWSELSDADEALLKVWDDPQRKVQGVAKGRLVNFFGMR